MAVPPAPLCPPPDTAATGAIRHRSPAWVPIQTNGGGGDGVEMGGPMMGATLGKGENPHGPATQLPSARGGGSSRARTQVPSALPSHCSPRRRRPPRVPLQGATGPAVSLGSLTPALSPCSAGRASPLLASGRGSEGEHPSARAWTPGPGFGVRRAGEEQRREGLKSLFGLEEARAAALPATGSPQNHRRSEPVC